MSNSLEHSRSKYHEAQDIEQSQQKHDSQAASKLEEARRLFRRPGVKQMYIDLVHLMNSKASFEDMQACYSPIFKELAQLIIGRDDIPAPPAKKYVFDFLRLFNSAYESNTPGWESVIKSVVQNLIDYITTEDQKRSYRQRIPEPYVPYMVKTAWKTPYVGKGDQLLRGAMNSMYIQSDGKPYGNFCSIIQGSGTGKSRLVDKLAESVFTIPMILRSEEDKTGFPFGDMANRRQLFEFFHNIFEGSNTALGIQRRYLKFLLKTIVYANNWIDDWKKSGHETKHIAAEWREYLGPPLSPNRLEMYSMAIEASPLEDFEDILNESLDNASLRSRVRAFITSVSTKLKPEGTETEPAILFYFDEAHHLIKATETLYGIPNCTPYYCMCKAFTCMMDAPVFGFFISTYSRLSEATPKTRNFWSSRPTEPKENDDNMNAPFVELPFDVWKEPSLVTEGTHSIDEICSLEFKARFGRPLFWTLLEDDDGKDVMKLAVSKLKLDFEDPSRASYSCDYPVTDLIAPIAARVDLTFELNPDEAALLEAFLVASSMRTVYSVPKHRQYLRGGYPSEPFLAEAAARAIFKNCQIEALGGYQSTEWTAEKTDKIIAKYKNDVPSAVSAWIRRGLIGKESRGELVARMLFTLAYDISILKNPSRVGSILDGRVSFSHKIPVVDFLRVLISEEYIEKILKMEPSNMPGKTFEEAFKDGYIHFTQFVKAGDIPTITDEAAYLFFVRAAAIEVYENMVNVGLVIPVWIRRNDYPDRWCMTAIFIQVMDRANTPFILVDGKQSFNFFTPSDRTVDNQRPYITIAMEFGVLDAQQKKAPGSVKRMSTVKGGLKTNERTIESVMSSTPERQPGPSPQVFSSNAVVETVSHEHEHFSSTSKKVDTHPRYDILIKGCSSRAYNVIDRHTYYSDILAHKDIVAEHPRHGQEYHDAIMRMKPYWIAGSSYNWATMRNNTRLGAPVVDYVDEADPKEIDRDMGDEDDVEMDDDTEDVILHPYMGNHGSR